MRIPSRSPLLLAAICLVLFPASIEAQSVITGQIDAAAGAALPGVIINAIGVFPIGTLVLLDTNELGVVYRNNSEDLMRPKVRVFADVDGEKEVIQIMDLTRKDTSTGTYIRSIKQMIDPHKYGIDVQRYIYWKH